MCFIVFYVFVFIAQQSIPNTAHVCHCRSIMYSCIFIRILLRCTHNRPSTIEEHKFCCCVGHGRGHEKETELAAVITIITITALRKSIPVQITRCENMTLLVDIVWFAYHRWFLATHRVGKYIVPLNKNPCAFQVLFFIMVVQKNIFSLQPNAKQITAIQYLNWNKTSTIRKSLMAPVQKRERANAMNTQRTKII